jgi:ribonuclease Z
MIFDVTILGCGAATPTSRHHPTSQVVNVHDKLFMVDCGEGTQMQLRKYKIRFQRINHIFISHLHGDHYLGLVGLISSLHLLGRINPLHIYGPPELKELIDLSLRVSDTYLNFPLEFRATQFKEKELIFEDKTLEVHSFPLKHRIDCCGFFFQEKPRGAKITKSMVSSLKLIPSEIIQLKKWNDVTRETGEVLVAARICEVPPAPRAYAFCSDTMYFEALAESISNVNLLYHESTFLDSERVRAKETFHSTAGQAAQMALKSNAQQLLLGHFSSRYSNDEDFLLEAQPIFSNCVLATEGLQVEVPFRDH